MDVPRSFRKSSGTLRAIADPVGSLPFVAQPLSRGTCPYHTSQHNHIPLWKRIAGKRLFQELQQDAPHNSRRYRLGTLVSTRQQNA